MHSCLPLKRKNKENKFTVGYVIPTKEQADCIFQIFSKRTEVTSTLVTTNLLPSDWGKILDSVTASAILDRLALNGKFIIFEGRSYRSKKYRIRIVDGVNIGGKLRPTRS
jgi:DNA replication protein DnaC